jgi:hypothetical protein
MMSTAPDSHARIRTTQVATVSPPSGKREPICAEKAVRATMASVRYDTAELRKTRTRGGRIGVSM